eukprot:scaffold1466_cov385-Prasinococcus_capsulatus_cf.AAC.19
MATRDERRTPSRARCRRRVRTAWRRVPLLRRTSSSPSRREPSGVRSLCLSTAAALLPPAISWSRRRRQSRRRLLYLFRLDKEALLQVVHGTTGAPAIIGRDTTGAQRRPWAVTRGLTFSYSGPFIVESSQRGVAHRGPPRGGPDDESRRPQVAPDQVVRPSCRCQLQILDTPHRIATRWTRTSRSYKRVRLWLSDGEPSSSMSERHAPGSLRCCQADCVV